MGVLEYSILAIVGVGAGFINVLAGGGSLLTVPAMVLMGVPGPVANGTNRIAIVAQAFTAILTFFRRGYYDLKLSASLAASLLPGAAIGAYFGTQIEGLMFNRLVAAIMIAVMIVSLTESRFKKNDQLIAPTLSPRQRQYLTHGLIALIGFYGGLIHIGIGFLVMPILHRVGGIDVN